MEFRFYQAYIKRVADSVCFFLENWKLILIDSFDNYLFMIQFVFMFDFNLIGL